MPTASQDCLAFRVGDQPFLVPVAAVVEVLPMIEVAPLPGAAPPILGAVNRRGRLVPVLDAGARLGCPIMPPGLDAYIVVVESAARRVGLLVTDVDGVITLDASGLARQPAGPGAIDPALLLGAAQTVRGLAPLLDPDRLVEA